MDRRAEKTMKGADMPKTERSGTKKINVRRKEWNREGFHSAFGWMYGWNGLREVL